MDLAQLGVEQVSETRSCQVNLHLLDICWERSSTFLKQGAYGKISFGPLGLKPSTAFLYSIIAAK